MIRPIHFRCLLILPAVILCAAGCSNPHETSQGGGTRSGVWYRQATVDLGHRIRMFSAGDGLAISRGRGLEVPGRLLAFHGRAWEPVQSFPYSDFPLIDGRDSSLFWSLHHLVHAGNYEPILTRWRNGKAQAEHLPRVMWDAADHVMWKGISRVSDSAGWMAGQQGSLLRRVGGQWVPAASPLQAAGKPTAFDGDLNDLAVMPNGSGWAVGRGGVILRLTGGVWSAAASPVADDLHGVAAVDDSLAWAAGDRGTLLRWNGLAWSRIALETRVRLNAVHAVDRRHAWAVGSSATLLVFDGEAWHQDPSTKILDDTFQDIASAQEPDSSHGLWIIGDAGIYTTSPALGFSFSDVTAPSSLRPAGKGGVWIPRVDESVCDLLVYGEDGPSTLYRNGGHGRFSDGTMAAGLLAAPADPAALATADVNNDGVADILTLTDNERFALYAGSRSGVFTDITAFSGLDLASSLPANIMAARFADLDNDGSVDLYCSSFDGPDAVFRNDGTGRFAPITPSIPKRHGLQSSGATLADFNNDGRVDVLIPYRVGEQEQYLDLLLNEGAFRFTVRHDAAFNSAFPVAPSVCIAADVNNDGWLDAVVHLQNAPPWLLLNRNGMRFERVDGRQSGLTEPLFHPDPFVGILNAADVNHDGWIDLFIGNRLYLNDPNGRFAEATDASGIRFVGHPTFADMDNDGDEDLLLGSTRQSLGKGERLALYRNNLDDGRWVRVIPNADRSNRSGTGTVVRITSSIGIQTRVVGLGSSPACEQDPRDVRFGVGADQAVTVSVHFPSGIVRRVEGVRPGSVIDVDESPQPQRAMVLAGRSVHRTLQTIDGTREVLRGSALLLFVIMAVLVTRRVAPGSRVARWWMGIVWIPGYAGFVHATAGMHWWASTGILVAVGAALEALLITIAWRGEVRRQARRISHFELGELLGRGGMGEVYRAVDTESGETVAVKLLNGELLADPQNRRRLGSEGQMLVALRHPYIVRVVEAGESHERAFIAMEYLSGGTLRALLVRQHPLPLAELRRLALQICDGLEAIHAQGIVHRDLKSGNIMLDAAGNIRIMDFGLSKSPLVTTMTTMGSVLGTLGYVAPEQITNQQVDGRTDLFSLGVLLYELSTGTLPFRGENEIALIHSIFNTLPAPPSTLRADLPPALDAIIARCIAKQPEDRFASASDVRAALELLAA